MCVCVCVCVCARACAWGIQTCGGKSVDISHRIQMNVYDHNYDFKLIKV